MTSQTTLPDGNLVVDASLLVGIVDKNRAAQAFVSVLSRSRITSVNFGEVLYKLKEMSGADPARVEQALTAAGVSVEPFELPDARHFPELKRIDLLSRDSQRAAGVVPEKITSLSLADMACLAYALEHGLPVLTGDSHWCTLGRYGLAVPVFDFRDKTTLP
jgi:PIN domain nuclease of toxin-antitoxin system